MEAGKASLCFSSGEAADRLRGAPFVRQAGGRRSRFSPPQLGQTMCWTAVGVLTAMHCR